MDLSTYPPTLQGTQEILRASTPHITKLWQAERGQHNTDDLVVIIDTRHNSMRLAPRVETYVQLKNHSKKKKNSLLDKLERPATAPLGAIAIWTITGFTEGPVFISNLIVARS